MDADVVGVLESDDRLPEIARNTGYPYYNVSLQLLSKYPIYEPSGADGLYGLIEVRPGYGIPFFNEHLDYVDWGPRALRNGNSVASVVKSETRSGRSRCSGRSSDERAARPGVPGLPHRRFQRALEPRLHGGDGRHA